jgi:hypothetical protein
VSDSFSPLWHFDSDSKELLDSQEFRSLCLTLTFCLRLRKL